MPIAVSRTPAYHFTEATRLLEQAASCAYPNSGAAIAYQAQVHIELAKALQANSPSPAQWDEICA